MTSLNLPTFYARSPEPRAQKEETDARLVSATLSGTFTYVGCYFLGTNFNYRLIFLILLVPLLLPKTAPSAAMRDKQTCGGLLGLHLSLPFLKTPLRAPAL